MDDRGSGEDGGVVGKVAEEDGDVEDREEMRARGGSGVTGVTVAVTTVELQMSRTRKTSRPSLEPPQSL